MSSTEISSSAVPDSALPQPPQAILMQAVGGCFVSQAAYVAAKLGIADLLAELPQTTNALATATNTHERSLYRVLRTLASVGIFTEVEPKVFANTPVSEMLLSDRPGSLRELTIWMGEEPHWRVYGEMLYSVQTGKPAWGRVHGQEAFPYLFETNKELGHIFNRAMTSFSGQTIPAIVEAYDFSQATVVADVGGGYGHLLAGVLKSNPSSRGILFDVPFVFEDGASALLEKEGVSERVQLVTGDFFKDVPVQADIYMLKHIIHDWDDQQCVTILENIRRSMADNARILIIETVIPAGNEPHFGKVMDMEMLVSPGGIERTGEEFAELLSHAGLKLTRIIPTPSPVCLVEAVKA